MKKIKFCSAIAAFFMLALAGCDLEIPESIKSPSIQGLIMSGTATVNENVNTDNMEFYFYPMFGTWTVKSSINGTVDSEETVTSTNAWWGNVHSTHTYIEDGETLELDVTAKSGDTFTPFFEGNDGTYYISINPNDGNTWGECIFSENAYYKATEFKEGSTYSFTITRNGGSYRYILKEATE